MPFTPIIGTLGYVLSRDGAEVLLIHRNARPDDEAYGKYNGLGGKLEADEDVAAGMTREIREEAGIEVSHMLLRGTISWPGFGKNGEDWLGFIFLVDGWQGEASTGNHEGTLHWVPLDTLLTGGVPLWPGDKHFLPLVFDGDPRPFHGLMPYEGQLGPKSWSFTR
jgi:8-oxo-dGTP diphosphatase